MNNTEVISYHLGGNSFPIVIKQGNNKLLVKLRAGLSGEYSLLSEWFGNRIGNLIGLKTRFPQWILLTESLKYDNIYIEVRDLIDKSLGINIGFEYLENVTEVDFVLLSKIDKKSQIEVYLLDLLMLNIDRTIQNNNLLIIEDDELLITDYDSSLIFNEIFNDIKLSNNKRILQCLKSNPFYQEVDNAQLKLFIDKINQIDFKEIISEIPSELLNQQNKELFLKKINDRKLTDWGLIDILNNLKEVIIESDNDRSLRIKKNREKLEKLTKSKHKA